MWFPQKKAGDAANSLIIRKINLTVDETRFGEDYFTMLDINVVL